MAFQETLSLLLLVLIHGLVPPKRDYGRKKGHLSADYSHLSRVRRRQAAGQADDDVDMLNRVLGEGSWAKHALIRGT